MENSTYFRTFATDRKQVDFGREKGVFPLVLIQVKSETKRTVFGLKNKRKKAFLSFKTQLFHIQVVRYAASGSVRAGMINDEGKELTVEEIGAPNLLASAFIFATENRFPVNVEAIGPCEVFVIGKERFLEFMRLHPLMMQNFLKDISDRSVFLSRKLNEFALLNLKTRLLKYLETHSVIHNQQEVAQKLGVTRPSLARALSELVNEGKIKK